MNTRHFASIFLTFLSFSLYTSDVFAQTLISNRSQDKYFYHGKEQYEQRHYALSIQSLNKYIQQFTLPTEGKAKQIANSKLEAAKFYKTQSLLKLNDTNAITEAKNFIASTTDIAAKQRVMLSLAQLYFRKNSLQEAINYYEAAGIDNLSNKEISDVKFELGYCYFNNHQFDKAKPLFASIKDLPDNQYYQASNYYYGLLAYNDKQYDEAIKSFNRIDDNPEYKAVVPYYKAEIYYFKGDYDKVIQIANRYLNKSEKLYYDKELHLLAAQTYFEQKKYSEAIPYFEYYYNNSNKIRKEELYEMAFSYYRTEQWNEAISKFKQLSNLQDSLGQTSMYLLGDSYLKINDKKSARNAFGICSNMDYNNSQQEAAAFLYAKLSYDLGDDVMATRSLGDFIKQYPNSTNNNEAHYLLANLLTKNNNFGEAFNTLNEMNVKDNETWKLYQQVAVCRALELFKENKFNTADSLLNLSLQQPINPNYEAIAYFWKSEIAFRQHHFTQTIQYANTFIDKAKNNEQNIKAINPQATIANAQLNIGFANMELNNYTQAQQAFADVQNNNSTTSDSLNNDALLSQADAAFMAHNLSDAYKLYTMYDRPNAPKANYAHYQRAIILGLQNKPLDKIALLKDLINTQATVSNYDDAAYELATTYIGLDSNQQAITLLKALSQSKNEDVQAKSILKLAYAYQGAGRTQDASDAYKKYLLDYPAANDRAIAIDALRNLYINAGTPDKFSEFVKANNLPDINTATLDKTYYEAAENEYADNHYKKAIPLFNNYLKNYPNGLSAIKAKYYLAESYYQTDNKDSALIYFKAVADTMWNDFSEPSALRVGNISLDKKDYANASKYFNQLLIHTLLQDSKLAAYEGLMKAGFETKNYNTTIANADSILNDTSTEPKLREQAQLYKAKANYEINNYDSAANGFSALENATNNSIAGEARYYSAKILLAQNKLKEAEDKAASALQKVSGNDNLMVRTYILLADILTAEKDYFNAKATLQSIIKNAKDPTLKAEAKDKLNKVLELEKAGSKLKE